MREFSFEKRKRLVMKQIALVLCLVALALAVDNSIIAKLNNPSDLYELEKYLNGTGAILVPLDTHSKRNIYFAVQNYTWPIDNTLISGTGFIIESVPPHVQHFTPTDPLYTNQKYLSFINVPKAWNTFGQGSSSQVIAIVDSGRIRNNSDLGNFWINTVDHPPADGIDQDDNGYIDDFNGGWNVVNNINSPVETGIPINGGSYFFSHGSAVWTTAAAPSNGYGIVGVSPKTRVVIVKAGVVSGSDVYFSAENLILGMDYIYALKHINHVNIPVQIASYGGGGYSAILENATQETLDTTTLFVVSAGNYNSNNDNTPLYPCNYNIENMLCVAAIETNGEPSTYTNYGVSTVDLSAPGTVIAPAVYPNGNGLFVWASGTSFSAPLVGGAAALLFGYNSTLTPLQVKACIRSSVAHSGYSLRTITNGYLNVYGAGVACSPALAQSGGVPPTSSPPTHTGSSSTVVLGIFSILL